MWVIKHTQSSSLWAKAYRQLRNKTSYPSYESILTSLLETLKTCLPSILRWLCIISTANWMLNWLGNNNDGFDLTSWKQSKLKFINSSNAASFERSNTQTWLLILSLCLRKIKRSESVLTSMISTQPVLRMNFRCPSLMSWLIIHVASKGCPSWMAFQGIIKSRCSQIMRSMRHSECH